MATNRGTIVTRGDRVVTEVRGWIIRALGVGAQSEQGNATAVNDVGGTVNTYGTRAHGVWAQADVGTARVVNSGNVTTHNTESIPMTRLRSRHTGSMPTRWAAMPRP